MSHIVDILKQKTTETDVKAYAVQLMKRAGSFDYTLSRIQAIERMVTHELHKVGGNQTLESLVNLLITTINL
jgi:geranylgeranyl diphosphate synthase type 3